MVINKLKEIVQLKIEKSTMQTNKKNNIMVVPYSNFTKKLQKTVKDLGTSVIYKATETQQNNRKDSNFHVETYMEQEKYFYTKIPRRFLIFYGTNKLSVEFIKSRYTRKYIQETILVPQPHYL